MHEDLPGENFFSLTSRCLWVNSSCASGFLFLYHLIQKVMIIFHCFQIACFEIEEAVEPYGWGERLGGGGRDIGRKLERERT